jgi:hypothetical protein
MAATHSHLASAAIHPHINFEPHIVDLKVPTAAIAAARLKGGTDDSGKAPHHRRPGRRPVRRRCGAGRQTAPGAARIEWWVKGSGWTTAPDGAFRPDHFIPGACRPVSAKNAARLGIPPEDLMELVPKVLATGHIDGGAAMDCDESARFEKAKAELTRGGGLVSRRFEWCKNWRDIIEEWDEI